MPPASSPFQRACVVGSGIAGLMATRVLSDFFSEVVLVEKDEVPDEPGFRRGVPQARHFHALIPGGFGIMAELFPELPKVLRDRGSLLPSPEQMYYYRPEGKSFRQTSHVPTPPADTGERRTYVQTRGLLEHCLRAQVEALPKVRTRYQTRVDEMRADGDRVVGLVLGDDSEATAFDLVVDASGQTCRSLSWLDALGFARPKEEAIHCDFAYTTVFLRPTQPELFEDVCFLVLPDPKDPHPSRGGGLIRVEGGLWMAAAGGRYGDYPPRDFEGLLSFFESLRTRRLFELVETAELVGSPAHHRFPKAVRRRFDALDAFPEGVLPIGDGIVTCNPMYGQGMSASCRQALALRRCLNDAKERGTLDGVWSAYFSEVYQETRAPWLFAALADFQQPGCKGDFPVQEMHIPPLLQYLASAIAGGDDDAKQLVDGVGNLDLRLDALENGPWPARMQEAKKSA